MSKFLKLCEKMERMILEQEGVPVTDPNVAADPNAGVPPGEPVADTGETLDPNTGSDVQEVSNDEIEQMIQSIVNFYQKGQALSADNVEKINSLPSKINAENITNTVKSLFDIFRDSNFPESSDS